MLNIYLDAERELTQIRLTDTYGPLSIHATKSHSHLIGGFNRYFPAPSLARFLVVWK
jgi:hypothetical protein